MKKIINIAAIVLLTVSFALSASAEKFKGATTSKRTSNSTIARVGAAGCLPAKSSTDININNVRARINTGGDMWWDLQNVAEYEIPKGSKKTAMFSASLWMGGVDVNGQLKGAFQRYRANGNDFWPGPLTNDGKASVTTDVCNEYDQHYTITRSEVDEFRLKYGKTSEYPDYVVPDIIKEWPAHPVFADQSYYLAPFFDADGNGEYDYTQGDYPYYDVDNALCRPEKNAQGEYEYATTMEGNGILADQVLKGDQTLWWVFNDNGNIHSETQGNSIGVEVRAQAFAFTTNDVINNMTFYTYEIINRSTFRLTETYFSQWVDTDLGYAADDYVGCDVQRGLGYCYNGTNTDGNGLQGHYGDQPPAVGVDFFQGPYMDPDGIDNPRYSPYVEYTIDTNVVPHDTIATDTIIKANCDFSINGVNFGDSIIDNERFGMRRFVYHNNTDNNEARRDPRYAPEYYTYLKGIWKDGTKMKYGGSGHVSDATGPDCDFMFPDDTDPCNWGTGGVDPGSAYPWTEESAGANGNEPGDRRFMQSAGPFTLEPGAVNYITVGIPWARAAAGGAFASVELLRTVDDKCQALFDNCFKVLDGPDAPELTIQELDKELILYIENIEASNNFNEGYGEWDPTISAINPDSLSKADRYDSLYRFQGYQIFQLANDEVSLSDINDISKARLVAQCDIKDDVDMIVNYYKDDKIGAIVPQIMVEGANEGLKHSFKITEDEFASGDSRLVNHKKYYFVAIAYGYNQYLKYTDDPATINGLYGQKEPYLSGRKSAIGPIQIITAIPHISTPEAEGTTPMANYGDGPKIKRLSGQGNGAGELVMTQESIDEILENNRIDFPVYENGHGPIAVEVIDPLNVKAGTYQLFFDVKNDEIDSSAWTLFLDGDTIATSDRTITVANQQLLLDYGFSITIGQVNAPGKEEDFQYGLINGTIEYTDSSRMWLGGLGDMDNSFEAFNWIRSGTRKDDNDAEISDYEASGEFIDPNEFYERILGGTWAPYRLTSKYEHGLAEGQTISTAPKMEYLSSVVIVYTPNKDLWTRCPVIEMGEDKSVTEGGRAKWQMRAGLSVDKEGNRATAGSGPSTNPNDPNYIGETGMGWFPGYAINIETGERLNMMFGESSWLIADNGRDMLFNPTSTFVGPLGQPIMGGKHFLYVFRNDPKSVNNLGVPGYDAGKYLYDTYYNNGSFTVGATTKLRIYSNIMWASIPMARNGYDWLSNEVKITLNVQRPYERFSWGAEGPTSPINDNWPAYEFNTDDIATQKGTGTVAQDALDLIAVVPNPYYAFSSYEETQVDNLVKVVNLPDRCTIRIYNAGGTLVRTLTKDNTMTSVEWDLKNHANIPIASGVYYIHVDAPGIGEKVVKWFGVLRPTDLNAF
jgi:hypothetical protein